MSKITGSSVCFWPPEVQGRRSALIRKDCERVFGPEDVSGNVPVIEAIFGPSLTSSHAGSMTMASNELSLQGVRIGRLRLVSPMTIPIDQLQENIFGMMECTIRSAGFEKNSPAWDTREAREEGLFQGNSLLTGWKMAVTCCSQCRFRAAYPLRIWRRDQGSVPGLQRIHDDDGPARAPARLPAQCHWAPAGAVGPAFS